MHKNKTLRYNGKVVMKDRNEEILWDIFIH